MLAAFLRNERSECLEGRGMSGLVDLNRIAFDSTHYQIFRLQPYISGGWGDCAAARHVVTFSFRYLPQLGVLPSISVNPYSCANPQEL